MTTEQFYTVDQTAQILNSNEQSIRRLINSNQLTAFKKLGKWYVFHSDIINFIKGSDDDG
jgi:hypothetical protein